MGRLTSVGQEIGRDSSFCDTINSKGLATVEIPFPNSAEFVILTEFRIPSLILKE